MFGHASAPLSRRGRCHHEGLRIAARVLFSIRTMGLGHMRRNLTRPSLLKHPDGAYASRHLDLTLGEVARTVDARPR